MGNLNNIGFGRACGERRDEEKGSSRFTLPGIPCILPVFFPLPKPTAKKPLWSKQHERGLCGGEREKAKIDKN